MNATDTVRNTLDLCTPPMSGTQSAKAYVALADLEALVRAVEACFAAVESGNVYWVADDDRINALAAAVARVKGDTT